MCEREREREIDCECDASFKALKSSVLQLYRNGLSSCPMPPPLHYRVYRTRHEDVKWWVWDPTKTNLTYPHSDVVNCKLKKNSCFVFLPCMVTLGWV